jgi:hypothetical protein
MIVYLPKFHSSMCIPTPAKILEDVRRSMQFLFRTTNVVDYFKAKSGQNSSRSENKKTVTKL